MTETRAHENLFDNSQISNISTDSKTEEHSSNQTDSYMQFEEALIRGFGQTQKF